MKLSRGNHHCFWTRCTVHRFMELKTHFCTNKSYRLAKTCQPGNTRAYCRRKLTLLIGLRVWPRCHEQLNLTLFILDDGLDTVSGQVFLCVKANKVLLCVPPEKSIYPAFYVASLPMLHFLLWSPRVTHKYVWGAYYNSPTAPDTLTTKWQRRGVKTRQFNNSKWRWSVNVSVSVYEREKEGKEIDGNEKR